MAHNYTPEEREFIERNYLGIKSGDLAQMFNAEFGTDLSRSQIKSYLTNHNLCNGVVCRFSKGHVPANKGKKMSAEVYARASATMFKKGHVPVNHKPVGSERIDKYGYTLVKVGEPSSWRPKHVIVWESVNGPVPKGHRLLFLDQNKQNFSIDNLVCVSASQMCVLNKRRLLVGNGECNKSSILLADLLIKTSRLSKRSKNDKRAVSTTKSEVV